MKEIIFDLNINYLQLTSMPPVAQPLLVVNIDTKEKNVSDESSADAFSENQPSATPIHLLISHGKAWLSIEQVKLLYGIPNDYDKLYNLLNKFNSAEYQGNQYYDALDILSLNLRIQGADDKIKNIKNNFKAFLYLNIETIETTFRQSTLFSELDSPGKRNHLRDKVWEYAFCKPSESCCFNYLNIITAVGSTFLSVFKPSYNTNDTAQQNTAIVLTIIELLALGFFLYLQYRDNEQVLNMLEQLHRKQKWLHPTAYEQEKDGKKSIVTGLPKHSELTKQSAGIVSGAVFGAISCGTFFSKNDRWAEIFGATAPLAASVANAIVNKRLNLELSVTKSILTGDIDDEEANLIAPMQL